MLALNTPIQHYARITANAIKAKEIKVFKLEGKKENCLCSYVT